MRRPTELTFRDSDSKQDERNRRAVHGLFTAEAQRTQRRRREEEGVSKRARAKEEEEERVRGEEGEAKRARAKGEEGQRVRGEEGEAKRAEEEEVKRFLAISLRLLGVLCASAVNLTSFLLRHPIKTNLLKTNLPVAIFVIAPLAFSPCAFAQFRPTGGQTAEGGARANQIPLSGRSGQTGTVTTTQTPTPGTTTSINTINPTIQTQGPFGGSVAGAARVPFSGRLSLREAVARGIEFNLGAVGLTNAVIESRGQRKVVRSALLPNLRGYLSETVQQINLQAAGFNFSPPAGQQIPGFSIPTVIGPFNFFDLRATLNQRVIDVTAWKNYGSAKEIVRANEETAEDASDLVVLAVGGAYLQVIAAQARIDAARATLETANALYRQALEKRSAGIVPQTDVNRAQIQALTEQQRLVTLQNDLAKQKINLARLTGLPVNEFYDITDPLPFSPAPFMPFDQALRLAFEQRSDLRAAEAQVRAAKKALSAARAERYPSFSIYADYGVIGKNPSQSHGTFTVVGTLNFPIWLGGRIKGEIEQAEAALAQRCAELEDIKGQIERDVRFAYLDMQAAASQVDVAMKNIQTARQNLDLARQRFDAGVSDNVEVVQSQEAVATAHLDYINSLFAHNVAKLSLARAIGRAAEDLPFFLRMQ